MGLKSVLRARTAPSAGPGPSPPPPAPPAPANATCGELAPSARRDCGYNGIDAAKCEAKACCTSPGSRRESPCCALLSLSLSP